MTDHETLLSRLRANRPLAHALFFKSRHQNKDAPFHHEIERDWASDTPNILTMAFRGSAKSTKAEEAITLEVAFQRTKNVLILGESEERAAERLAAVKNHIEYNEELRAVFDLEPGDPWTTTRACTSTGVMIQAYGRMQSLRGVKHLDNRPDLIFLDDIEDKESVASPEARRKTLAWFTSTVMPTLVPNGRMRMAATPLHPEALAPTLAKADKSWQTKTYPIIYDPPEWKSAWPDRFPVATALKMRDDMAELGRSEDFVQEFLCEATDPGSQVFTPDLIRVEPQIRSWHAVYAIFDPARTTNKSSATTGKAVASWIGRKLVVWEASALKQMPSEIIEDIFQTAQTYNPVCVGVEENGLNEWLLQPIRSKQAELGLTIPLRALQAPRGKLDFIRGLQPYFRAGEVEFAKELPDLRAQLLGFPTGHIDAPNALAYMLRLGLGVPVYDNFRMDLIDQSAKVQDRTPKWLLINTSTQITTAQLVQVQAGRVVILADWLVEADAGQCLTDLVMDANLAIASGGTPPGPGVFPPGKAERRVTSPTASLRSLAPKQHFDAYSIHGLRAACRKASLSPSRGGDPSIGREELRSLMRRSTHGRPALAISPSATWTLRAFAGGYARDADKAEPQSNAYAVLIEALEAFAALMRVGTPDMDSAPNYAYTDDGRRYITALAR